jgi:glycosyltransferase involved in cell wall biosynthesis
MQTSRDVLIVSAGSTGGWRAADEELAESMRRAGLRVEVARAVPPREVRTFMLTDLLWARAARAAAREALRAGRPRAIIYSSSTAALLWPAPGAIRFDTPAARNRPGRHGLWQRPLEQRRLREAPLLVPWSEAGLEECGPAYRAPELDGRVVVLPMPVETSGPTGGERDIAAITYAANPAKKRTAHVLDAWLRIRRDSEELVVAGCEAADLARAGITVTAERGVRVVGRLAADEYRALLRRARVFVCAPRREDYGIAQLEALADGCRLVSAPAEGPYVALPLARQLDSRYVDADLGSALRKALDDDSPDYATRAAALLEPFRRVSADRIVAAELLPRLLG